MKGKKTALIFGGCGIEGAVSRKTARCVEGVLKTLPGSYFTVEAGAGLFQKLQTERPDRAFLAVHGIYGEDGTVQAVCELLKIPYTGSGLLASALCMDKLFFKNLLLKHKIATPPFQPVPSLRNIPVRNKYPAVVKASHGGSTLGTFIVKGPQDLPAAVKRAGALGRSVFIEDFLSRGKEAAVSWLNGRILTPVEIVPRNGFYDYKHKYEKGYTDYILPPRLPPLVTERMKALSEKVIALTGVRGYARLDFIVQDNTPWLLELNTLPGLTETSLLPKSAGQDGVGFSKVIETILSTACLDYPSSPDGGSIAQPV